MFPQTKKRPNFSLHAILILLWLALTVSESLAGLKLTSCYPTLGVSGQDRQVDVRGTGFDEHTRISIFTDAGNRKAVIGSTDIPSDAKGVAIMDGIAYVADGFNGLQIIDVRDLSNPVHIGTLDTQGIARELVVRDSTIDGEIKRFIYLADGHMGLQIIDVTNPSSPERISSVDTVSSSYTGLQNQAYDVEVVENVAYLANGTDLQIIDVHDPYAPQIMKTINENNDGYEKFDCVWSVAALAGRLYIGIASTQEEGGLSSIRGKILAADISDLEYFHFTDSISLPDIPTKIDLENSMLYAVCGNSGLQIMDVSIAHYARLIGFLNISSYCHSLAVTDNKAYVSAEQGLHITDVSDPFSPKEIGVVGTPGRDVALADNVAYVAGKSYGMQFIDIKAALNPGVIASMTTERFPRSVAIKENAAYVATAEGLQLIDITDPSAPISPDPFHPILPEFDDVSVTELVFANNKAYVLSVTHGLQILDADNPLLPDLKGFVDTPGNACGIAVWGDTAYVADGDEGLQIIDIHDSSNPAMKETWNTQGTATAVAADKNIVYVAVSKDDGGNEIQITDVSDLSNPAPLCVLEVRGSSRMELRNDNLYVLNSRGFEIINVSNPSAPILIKSVELHMDQRSDFVRDFTIVGDTAYLGCHTLSGEKLQVTDIRDPDHPVSIASFIIPGEALGVAVAGNMAYVACGWSWKFAVIPMPIEIVPDDPVTETKMSLRLPSPRMAGHYTLKAFNASESYDLPGALTFVSPDQADILNTKAIIVAGRRGADDSLWKEFKTCANHAYNVLLYQGYTRESIYYLSNENIDADGDGLLNDVDGVPTHEKLRDIINQIAASESPAHKLLLYMVGHGGKGSFVLDSDKKLDAVALKDILDGFQQAVPGKIIFIYDACFSGSFLPLVRPEHDVKRFVITSTNADEEARFLSPTGLDSDTGKISFSFQFWSGISYGLELREAFLIAKDHMMTELPPPQKEPVNKSEKRDSQEAHLDANGNGIGNDDGDYKSARGIAIRRGYVTDMDPPVIDGVCYEQSSDDSDTARILAATKSGKVSKMLAIIRPSCYNPASVMPIAGFPTILLQDSDNDGTYEADYDGFKASGTYHLTIYAENSEGLYSLPGQTTVIRENGVPCAKEDINGDMFVDLADVISALKVMAGGCCELIRPDYVELFVSEGGDGKLTLDDVSDILEKITKIEEQGGQK